MAQELTADQDEFLRANSLFAGISAQDIPAALELMQARVRCYAPHEVIQRQGEPVVHAGLVLEGEAWQSFLTEEYEDVLLMRFSPGKLFCLPAAWKGVTASPVQVTAQVQSLALMMQVDLLRVPSASLVRAQLLANLSTILAERTLRLSGRVRILLQSSIRERLVLYLTERPASSEGFVALPSSQTELAKYLGVNRSALSREISRMKAEGLLEVQGQRMRLTGKQAGLSL